MERNLHELKRRIAVEAAQIEFLIQQIASHERLPKEEVKRKLQEIKESLFYISEDAIKSARYSAFQLFCKRFAPLLITGAIGLVVAWVLSFYDEVIAKYAAVYVLSPLVSALSGNYGLQVASKEIRAIAVGHGVELLKLTLRECGAAVLTGLSLGTVLGLIGMAITNSLLALPVLVISLTLGLVTSAIMGSLMPYLIHRLGFDPAFLVGPFETTLQDLASYSTFVIALLVFGKILG